MSKEALQQAIGEFIAGQIANQNSPQAAALACAMTQAIIEYKARGGDNENGFSANAFYEDGVFTAKVSFYENYNMTVLFGEDTDNEMVAELYELRGKEELARLAGLMLSEGWVEGYQE